MGAQIEANDSPRHPRALSSVRVILLGVTAAALLGVGIGAALHLSLRTAGAQSAQALPALEGQAVWEEGSRPAPDFTLRDQRGQLVPLSAQRGKTVVLAFMDSRCRQVCPIEGRVLARAIGELPAGARPTLLVVSVDPWADTRSSAFAAAAHWGFAGSWHWLFGTRLQLAKVWRAYRIYVKRTTGDIVHSDAVYVIDRRGFERAGFLFPFLPGPLERDLMQLGREARA